MSGMDLFWETILSEGYKYEVWLPEDINLIPNYSSFLITPPPLDWSVLSISDGFDGFVTPMRIRPSDTNGSYRSGFFQLGIFAVMSSVSTVVRIALSMVSSNRMMRFVQFVT